MKKRNTTLMAAPISFCSRLAFNVRNNVTKQLIVKQLFEKFNIIITDRKTKIYRKHVLNNLVNYDYLISTNTKGNKYYLFLTKNNYGDNCCYFIDTKIVKGYELPRVIYTHFRFKNQVFNNTLLEGELIKDYNNNWLFLLNDIHSFIGNSCKKLNKYKRIDRMFNLLKNYYYEDPYINVCPIRIKRFFKKNDIEFMVNEFIPQLKYPINGLLFNNYLLNKINILFLFPFKTDFNLKYKKSNNNNNNNKKKISDITSISSINSSSSSESIEIINYNIILPFIIRKNKNLGIYNLICYVNKNEKIFGVARINNLDTQELINELLDKNKEKNLIMDCKYNKKFKKFVPFQESDILEPVQYLDSKKYLHL